MSLTTRLLDNFDQIVIYGAKGWFGRSAVSVLFDENLYLSSRNLPHILVIEARYADPVSLVHFPKVIATTGSVKQLEEMFA